MYEILALAIAAGIIRGVMILFQGKRDKPFDGYIYSVDKFRDLMDENRDLLCEGVLRTEVLGRLKLSKETIKEDVKQPSDLHEFGIPSICMDAIVDLLLSCKFHTYRGRLNLIGDDLMKFYGRLLRIAVDLGELSQAEAAQEMKDLREEVRKTG